jgi:hypothetical protein
LGGSGTASARLGGSGTAAARVGGSGFANVISGSRRLNLSVQRYKLRICISIIKFEDFIIASIRSLENELC